MRFASLTEELYAITQDYDYGIVPGSAAVFVKDEVLGIGRLDLTLLENVIVVVEVSRQGYKIASSSPLSDDSTTLAAAEKVQACVDRDDFDSMESLLMTASPLFRERFQSTLKAQSNTQAERILLSSPSLTDRYYQDTKPSFNDNTTSSSDQQDLLDEINQWIH